MALSEAPAWDDRCCHVVAGRANEPLAYCESDQHSEADILARWRTSLNGYANGKSFSSQVTDWLLALTEHVKTWSTNENAYRQQGVDRNTYREWMFGDLKSLPERQPDKPWYRPPVGMPGNDLDVDKEIWGLIDSYLPAAKEEPKPRNRSKGLILATDYLIEYAERAARPSVVADLLYGGTFNMLLGRAYAGKSTIATALTKPVALGQSFLNRSCTKLRCAYLALERNGADIANRLKQWGIADIVFFADEIIVPNVAAFVEAEIKRLSLEFIIIDHLQNIARIDDGNAYAEVSNALMPYQEIAKRTGCCILALHHQGKPDKQKDRAADETVIDALGSEAYRASSDLLMEATTYRGEFFLRAQPRTGTDIERTKIEIDMDTGDIVGTNTEAAERQSALEAIQEYLFRLGTPQTEAEIRAGVIGKTKVLSDALRDGLKHGLFSRQGLGGRKEAFKYTIGTVENNENNENSNEDEGGEF